MFMGKSWQVATPACPSQGPARSSARQVRRVLASAAACAALVCSQAGLADAGGRHQQSASYDVYLGIVPAAQTIRDEQLDRLHRISGQHVAGYGDATQHVTIAVFRRSDGERVQDADIRAELVESDLIRVKRTEKPLNLRRLSDGATYCNFFDRHWHGQYRLRVSIKEEDGYAEKVTFAQRW